jgi:hypothetical protein
LATHPHRRRLPRHARHIINQMLKVRVAVRASVLQTHARQLDSAVNLAEDRSRLHPDHDRHALGVRVAVGPETRSLLVQLRDSRDLRTQQQLVREIIHQLTKRMLAALKRAARLERAKAAASRAARATGKRARRARGWLALLWVRTRARVADRARGPRSRAGRGARTTTRLSRSARVTRTRDQLPGRETREMLALGRTGMGRKRGAPAATRTKRSART